MMATRFLPWLFLLTLPLVEAQQGARNGEWRYYGGDSGTTKYSALDQIDAKNVKELKVVWEWKAQNFGRRPDFNWEVTPLMAGGVLYFTAGTRRDAIAVDAATGETLWMYRIDEGPRGAMVARTVNRGLAYWSDGKGDARILLISPGFQLIALNAKTGTPVPGFGKDGIVDLTEGLDRDVVKPGQIGASFARDCRARYRRCGRRVIDRNRAGKQVECAGVHPRLRCAHRQAHLDL